jgi:hypothetical protein
VGTDAAGKGKRLEKALHAFLVLALVRIDLRIGAFQIARGQHARCAMTGAGEEDGVEVVLDDQPVEVDVGEGQRRAGPPVAEGTLLDVLGLEGLAQQRIVLQIDHACRQVVAGLPPGMHVRQFPVLERRSGSGFVVHVVVLISFWELAAGLPPGVPLFPVCDTRCDSLGNKCDGPVHGNEAGRPEGHETHMLC